MISIDSILYVVLFVSVFVLCVVSFYVKDIDFIVRHPFDFFMELFFVSVIPALLMVFVFAKTRRFSSEQTTVWFYSLLLKLMIFHILFQISGIYSYTFGRVDQ